MSLKMLSRNSRTPMEFQEPQSKFTHNLGFGVENLSLLITVHLSFSN